MKKIYYILIAFILLFSFNVKASTNTYERTQQNNYGVKKEINTDGRLSYIMKTKYVNASEKIYDFSNILTDEEERELKTLIDAFYNKTKMDLVIVTDNLPYTNDEDNVTYAEDFYDYNDFGMNTKHHDGIVFFRNTYERDPYYDMTLSGEAQRYYTTRIDPILDAIYSEIKGRQYLSGLKHFINLLSSYYDKGIPEEMKDYYLDETGHLRSNFNRVTFETDGGTIIPVQKLEKNQLPEKPNDPTKDGYEFVEWQLNGQKYDFNEPPQGDITLVAKWKKIYQVPTIFMIIASVLGTSIFTGVNIKKNKMVKHSFEAGTFLDKSSIQYTNVRDDLVNTVVTHHFRSSDSGGSSFGGSSGGGGFSSHTGSSGFGHTSGGRHG